MESETSPGESPESIDERCRRAAVSLILAVHRSIDWRAVNPRTYWERMPAALRARAQMATTFGALVESVRRALSIPAYRSEEAKVISSLAAELDDPAIFRRFCRIVKDETAFLAVEARVTLDAAKKERADAGPATVA